MILTGDCLDVLPTIAARSIHACVTSPPYYGLRDYGSPPRTWGTGWTGALRLEPSPDLYIEHLVEVFREVRRVLRDDGTLWLNLGDSFAANRSYQVASTKGGPKIGSAQAAEGRGSTVPDGLKPLDLLGIPWRAALALQADGWYLRSDVVWAKPNCMPESVRGVRWERCRVKVRSAPEGQIGYAQAHETPRRERVYNPEVGGQQYVKTEYEPCPGCPKCSSTGGLILRRGSWRPTRAHEFIFQLTKTGDYYADSEAVAEEAVSGAKGSTFTKGKTAAKADLGLNAVGQGERNYDAPVRNKRSVWTVASQPFKEAHFAVFPPALIEPCILASTSEVGVCPACGAPWARIVERTNMIVRPSDRREAAHEVGASSGRTAITGTMEQPATTTTTGWRKTCACPGRRAVPATVLDPFSGSGTTAMVSKKLGRQYIGIDVKKDYSEMAERRIASVGDGS